MLTHKHTLALIFLGRKKFFFLITQLNFSESNRQSPSGSVRKYYLYFLPSQVSPPHLTDPWKKPCRFSQQERVRKASADAQHILSILLKASCAPSVHANIHDGFSNSCPVQGYMKRWPCWPLSCGQMPTTKRTWCSSKMSSVRGVWDTWWRWGFMILVRMVQALQMITCNIIIWITNF